MTEIDQMQTTPVDVPFAVSLLQNLLVVTFPTTHEILSWTLNRPGFQKTDVVAWIELRNADLPLNADIDEVIHQRLAGANLEGVPALVTSRAIAQHHFAMARIEGANATCLTTVGLSNGERVGERSRDPFRPPGTINTLVHTSEPLSQAAFVEAVAIVATARTAAIMDSGARRNGVAISGTGTDCILVAAPPGPDGLRFCGLHTAMGEAIGAAVYQATRDGITTWQTDIAAAATR